jgi:hypothetical protein
VRVSGTFPCTILGAWALLALGIPGTAAQGVYDELVRQQNQPAPEVSSDLTEDQVCKLVVDLNEAVRCKSHFVTMAYDKTWQGLDSRSSHPIAFEVLEKDSKAVLCTDQFAVRPNSWCVPMERSR